MQKVDNSRRYLAVLDGLQKAGSLLLFPLLSLLEDGLGNGGHLARGSRLSLAKTGRKGVNSQEKWASRIK